MGGTTETVSERVIHAVATRANSDPLELPPLFDAIDPEALEEGVRSISEGTIRFEYAGYTVTVDSDETVTVGASPSTSAAQAEHALDD